MAQFTVRQLDDEVKLHDDLQGRVLPFDEEAAKQAALIEAERKRSGRSADLRDTSIAGALSRATHRSRLATSGTSRICRSRS